MANPSFKAEKTETAGSTPESGSLESNPFGLTDPYYGGVTRSKEGIHNRIWNSFKRDPNLHATPHGVISASGSVFDVEAAAQATADSPLARKLKSRHLQMIAIGGSIGMAHYQSLWSRWRLMKA